MPSLRSRFAVILLCHLCLGAATSASARPLSPVTPETPLQGRSVTSLLWERLRGPLQPNGLNVLALGGLTAGLTENLESPEQEVSFLEHRALEGVSDVGNLFGAGEFAAVSSLGLWTAGSVLGLPRVDALGRDLTATLAATTVYTWALKAAVRRPRPSGGPWSFPSGHTAVAFATATVIGRHLGRKAGTLAYVAATCTAAARMEDNRHYFSDVSFGAALGMAVAGVELPFDWWGSVRQHTRWTASGLSFEFGF